MSFLVNPYQFEAVGGTFVPSDIAGLTLWYDPSDGFTIAEASGAVSQLNDKSGNNYHATQAVATNRPTISAGSIGGLNALNYDGSNDRLDVPNPSGITGSQNRSLFTVFKYDTVDAKRAMFGLGAPSTGQAWSWGVWNTGFMAHTIWFGDYISPTLQPGTSLAHIGSVILSGTTMNDTTIGLDGVQEQISGFSNTVNTGTNNSRLGSNVGAVDFMDGLVGEVLLYNSALLESDRQKVEGYLAHKWGLTGNLDAGHPYKSAAP